MDKLIGTAFDTIKQFGQTFLTAYFPPALVLMAVLLYLFIPIWLIMAEPAPQKPKPAPNTTAAVITPTVTSVVSSTTVASTPSISSTLALSITIPAFSPVVITTTTPREPLPLVESIFFLLSLSVLVAMMMVGGLNNALILLFEGRIGPLRNFLTRRKREDNKKRQQALSELKQAYRDSEQALRPTNLSETVRQQLETQRGQARQAVETLYEQFEQTGLPQDDYRIKPTRFGNTYALAEEYAYHRYGLDAVLFWSRLQVLLQEKQPDFSAQIANQKTRLDMVLNWAMVSILVSGMAFVTWGVSLWQGSPSYFLLCLGVGSLLLFIGFYYGSVGAVQSLGELIKISYDRYRHLLAESFGLTVPDDLVDEQKMWVKLTKFIRWGDIDYFPAEFRQQDNESPSPIHLP